MKNIKQRQTYSGVLNRYNQECLVTPYEPGNGENTVALIEDLQALHPEKKLILLWDRARYHWGKEIQAYLHTVNQGLEEKDWKVTCLVFAPNAPDQKPVEDS